MQHPGESWGFLKVTGSHTLAWADITYNKQYISAGNAGDENRVSLFLTDCPNQRRLKIMDGARMVERDEPDFSQDIINGECDAPAERAWLVDVAALDLKCPKHITPRFTEADIAPTVDKLIKRIHDLEAQLELAAYSKPR